MSTPSDNTAPGPVSPGPVTRGLVTSPGPRSRPRALLAIALLLGLAALGAAVVGCGDPTKEAEIEALGDEAFGVPVGPLHRPGQPCNVCHDGETAREFAIAGTVYWALDSRAPAPGTRVDMIDADGNKQLAITNCAGNFFVLPEDRVVRYPYWVKLTAPGASEITMDSPVNGDGSCATCHHKTFGTRSTGRVYLYENPPGPPPSKCP